MKRQVAAIPVMVNDSGERRVMLMTSRETRRWVIPKGWPIKGLKSHMAAVREAWEEAGIIGCVAKKPIGSYEYLKRLGDQFEPCNVKVFLLAVEQQSATWPEKGQREFETVSFREAAERVDEPGLKSLFETLESQGPVLTLPVRKTRVPGKKSPPTAKRKKSVSGKGPSRAP